MKNLSILFSSLQKRDGRAASKRQIFHDLLARARAAALQCGYLYYVIRFDSCGVLNLQPLGTIVNVI